jgi:hypothetical protein
MDVPVEAFCLHGFGVKGEKPGSQNADWPCYHLFHPFLDLDDLGMKPLCEYYVLERHLDLLLRCVPTAGNFSATSTIFANNAANSPSPVEGMMMVSYRSFTFSVILRKRPREFSRKVRIKVFLSI